VRIGELFDPTLSVASPELIKEGDRKRMRGKSCGVGEESDVSMDSLVWQHVFFFARDFSRFAFVPTYLCLLMVRVLG
jgi:hypothetical protein